MIKVTLRRITSGLNNGLYKVESIQGAIRVQVDGHRPGDYINENVANDLMGRVSVRVTVRG